MIKISERFEFERGEHCWQLHEHGFGRNQRTKVLVPNVITTYHGSVMQICKWVIDKESGSAESLDELVSTILNTEKVLGAMYGEGNKV